MNNILILGDGTLGSEITSQTNWSTLSRKVDGFDITDLQSYDRMLNTYDGMVQKCDYDVIVNCIANTDTYSQDRQLHWDVNYKGTANLVEFCNKWEVKLVQISSDYVYANSTGCPTELDTPVHQETYYAYTKLLADGFVELKANNYLIIRATHKPTPFPYSSAWVDQVGNFDYVDTISSLIIQLVRKNATGIYNVGTELKSMKELALRTNSKVNSVKKPANLIPSDTSMNISKLQKYLNI